MGRGGVEKALDWVGEDEEAEGEATDSWMRRAAGGGEVARSRAGEVLSGSIVLGGPSRSTRRRVLGLWEDDLTGSWRPWSLQGGPLFWGYPSLDHETQ